MSQKISPHLWFDKEAKEAAAFYVSVFKDGAVKSVTSLEGTPSGSVDLVTMELFGQAFTLISAGPFFKFTPAISFLVACKTKEEVERLWAELSQDGKALMELGTYPFSEKYGWIQDKYGLSWQLMYMGERPITQIITPTLMFVGEVCGKAEEAMQFYTSIFHHTKIDHVMRYEAGESLDQPGTIKHAGFTLEGESFAIMDSAHKHAFTFNEAISFQVHCDTQEEIDYYWEKLSARPESEQCGWLKDKYGVSWQIVPTLMEKLFAIADKEAMARVTKAFLAMKKFDIAALQKAYEGV